MASQRDVSSVLRQVSLWRDRGIGWGNLSVNAGSVRAELGYVSGRPARDRTFAIALDAWSR